MKVNRSIHNLPKKRVIQSVTLLPHRRTTLHIGEVNNGEQRPGFHIEVHATVKEQVSCVEKLLGNEEHYVITYEVENNNDSPAFIDVIEIE